MTGEKDKGRLVGLGVARGYTSDVIERMPAVVGIVIVADNNSADGTAAVARSAGATVVFAPRRGYGYACRAGCDAASAWDIVVFIDGDGSMSPEDIPRLTEPIVKGDADIVCGRRQTRASVMPWHQRLGNWVVAGLLFTLYRVRLSELGPFRAVRSTTLSGLEMPGSRFRWPAQLLARAARADARIIEVDVSYAARTAGESKVGGSLKGTLAASWDISGALLSELRWRPR